MNVPAARLPAAAGQPLQEPAAAKARTVVGLDVHATKIVAAALDVETGELSPFPMGGEAAAAAGFCGGYRVRCGFASNERPALTIALTSAAAPDQ